MFRGGSDFTVHVTGNKAYSLANRPCMRHNTNEHDLHIGTFISSSISHTFGRLNFQPAITLRMELGVGEMFRARVVLAVYGWQTLMELLCQRFALHH